ncbi:MAG: hypothetical protein A3G18_03470 [Rhodospirillales bacterium RIFCSPLOWO2_12_FULL_58_28]|nr:MAG: hypothetical protein A3H92_01140 [Rhodospirillales bacterium RIFCSPLOWO2_02_FULL_58_16]OHC76828.1 MAG: hypothetical protein A3G18_03470 [Rhodospirillales bacterium RIFCSPLOWO2_12_FULL_58_28]
MLKRLRFTNFKTWTEADLTLGRITGLFGANSSGKTSIIQFLLMLKQTKDATDRAISLELNGPLVELGTINDALYAHDDTRKIKLMLAFERETELALADPSGKHKTNLAQSKNFEIEAEIGVHQKAPRAIKLSYKLGDWIFSLAPRNGDDSQFELSASGPDPNFRFVRTTGRPWQLPRPVKTYAFPDQVRTYFQNAGFLSDLEAAYEAELNHIFYLGPLREYPKRDYLWARSSPSDVGQRGEKAIDAILAATEAGEVRNLKPKATLKSFQEMIAYWLREMGLVHDFRIKEIAEGSNRWQAILQTRAKTSEVMLTDVGFGVSQVLPVLILLYYVPEGSTVVLEQPEIHLHPSAQAGLADAIINVATHRRVQVIIESHSEHLLLRLQRRIAEGLIPADDTKLYFCNARDGESVVDPLRLDLFGNIENWPKNFMGDAFGEAAAAEKARLKKLKAGT